jgi:hypothetical protein
VRSHCFAPHPLLTRPSFSCKDVSDETQRYSPFIFAFNYAFQALKSVTGLPLRDPSDLDILFHRNDPKTINAIHRGNLSQRKPDVVLISHNAACEALAPEDTAEWSDYAFKTSIDRPAHNFQWKDPLLTAEFKRKKKKLDPPPDVYHIKPALSIAPQAHPMTVYEMEEVSSSQEKPAKHDAVEPSSKADSSECTYKTPICDFYTNG